MCSIGGTLTDGRYRCTRSLTCSSTILTITNPTWNFLLSMPDLRREKPATNRLNVSSLFLSSVLCSKAVRSKERENYR